MYVKTTDPKICELLENTCPTVKPISPASAGFIILAESPLNVIVAVAPPVNWIPEPPDRSTDLVPTNPIYVHWNKWS